MASRMFQHINHNLVVTVTDGRELTGIFKAYDKHMNLVLEDVTERRPLAKKGAQAPRKLGLVLLRGEHVVAVRAEKKAAAEEQAPAAAAPANAAPALPGKKAKN